MRQVIGHISSGLTRLPVRRTKYEELGYVCVESGVWRFVDLETYKCVGEFYPDRRALLDDVDRYASQWGCKKGA